MIAKNPGYAAANGKPRPTVKPPPLYKRNPVIRLLSSVWVGIVLMALLLIYASLFSALPKLRGAVEMTEMMAFRHWLFVGLVVAFCTVLTTATVTRIRWNLINLGVLTTHLGLILLTAGCVWYFGTKIEGDVRLLSPRVELLTSTGEPINGASILPETGREWSSFMPAFGGAVAMRVVDSAPVGTETYGRATVRVTTGDAPPRDVTLSEENPIVQVSDRLKLRLKTFPAQSDFYDDEAPVMYVQKAGQPLEAVAGRPIRHLPIHRERYLDEGYVIQDRAGEPVPSKRTSPAIELGSLSIPTGWFESWRLPIDVPSEGLPFDMQVTGFLPYVTATSTQFAGGGGTFNPALKLMIGAANSQRNNWLVALDPARNFLNLGIPFEFRWVTDAAEREALMKPMAGAHELHVKVLDPPFEQTFAITDGQKIQIDGTSYELTIKQLAPSWPMMTPGYEGAMSPMASVDVTSAAKSYNRTVIQRFPELSQDIDEQGVRHKTGPYDPNLVLDYRTAANSWVLITAGPALTPELAIFTADGRIDRRPLKLGEVQKVDILGLPLQLAAVDLVRDAQQMTIPVVEPIDRRRANMTARAMSAVRLKLTGKDALAGWSRSQWVLYSMYPDEGAQPATLTLPTGEEYVLTYSRDRVPLGATVYAGKLDVEFQPGRDAVKSWSSHFQVRDDDGRTREAMVQTNETAAVGRWTLFQSGAAQDHWSYTILGVGNRRGISPMSLGCIFITVGCLYAFYVKPVLRRRKNRRDAVYTKEADAIARPLPGPRGRSMAPAAKLAEAGS